MERYLIRKEYGRLHLGVPLRGARLLTQPLFNKGTAFTRSERAAFGLEGLLPDAVSTMDQQARRAYANIVRKEDPLERYIGLAALQDRNEHLFHRLLVDHLDEFLPIVYAPTVGRACQEFSRIFRRARGLWITPAHQGRMGAVLANTPHPDVRLVVVTDNERVLGLGDQGAGGLALPVGKAALYTAAAGLHPAQVLPISLDVGTDNAGHLGDDLYLGWRWPRLRGPEYDGFVEEFVHSLHRRFPHAVVQWEDLKPANALRVLDRYQRLLPSFNDDVQGTGAAVLAALLTAARITGRPLSAQRVVIAGAGAPGLGIARVVREALVQSGRAHDDVASAVAVVDHQGLVVEGARGLGAHKREVAWPAALAAHHGLGQGARGVAEVVRQLRPTVLVGTTGRGGLFTEGVVKQVGSVVERPVILPLSTPQERAEARPQDVVAWTGGRALIATGLPATTIDFEGTTSVASQLSSVFVFPGVALGAVVSKAYEVTPAMFRAAATQLAEEVTPGERAEGRLLPPLSRLREITPRIAEAVIRAAREAGVGLALDDAAIPRAVAEARWEPSYPLFDPLPETPDSVPIAPAATGADRP
jgi:malate dehydrogenase (oxaloacetate-decarboxylating)